MADAQISLKNTGPAEDYDGPPDYRVMGRHALFPKQAMTRSSVSISWRR